MKYVSKIFFPVLISFFVLMNVLVLVGCYQMKTADDTVIQPQIANDSIMKTKVTEVQDNLVFIDDGVNTWAFYADSLKEGDWVYVHIVNDQILHISTESFDDLMNQFS